MAISNLEAIKKSFLELQQRQKILEKQHNEVTKMLNNIKNMWVLIVVVQVVAWLF